MSDRPPVASVSAPARVPRFACTWHTNGVAAAWVRIAGEVDLTTAPQLETALTNALHGTRVVVVDLREVTFMDSTGLHALLEADRNATKIASRLVCVRGSHSLSRLFALAGIERHLQIVDLHPAEPPAQALLRMPDDPTDPSSTSEGMNRCVR